MQSCFNISIMSGIWRAVVKIPPPPHTHTQCEEAVCNQHIYMGSRAIFAVIFVLPFLIFVLCHSGAESQSSPEGTRQWAWLTAYLATRGDLFSVWGAGQVSPHPTPLYIADHWAAP